MLTKMFMMLLPTLTQNEVSSKNIVQHGLSFVFTEEISKEWYVGDWTRIKIRSRNVDLRTTYK